jgi:hypothetical protein
MVEKQQGWLIDVLWLLIVVYPNRWTLTKNIRLVKSGLSSLKATQASQSTHNLCDQCANLGMT